MGKGTGDVKLLGAWRSPYAVRVNIALNLKSVDYEFQTENLATGSKSELLIKSNPVHKKIPVLLHGGKPICESLIIVQYIDEVWSDGPSILPSDPYDRAVARFWAAYVDDKFYTAVKGIVVANGEEAKAAAVKVLKDGLVLLEEAFLKSSAGEGKPFFGGDEIGYLDIALGSFLSWFKVTEKSFNVKLLEEAATPRLVSWADSFYKHRAVKDELPDTDKLFELAQNVIFPHIQAAAAAK
ncbi:Glutathione S-transferase U17 [Dionaea muscipula]